MKIDDLEGDIDYMYPEDVVNPDGTVTRQWFAVLETGEVVPIDGN